MSGGAGAAAIYIMYMGRDLNKPPVLTLAPNSILYTLHTTHYSWLPAITIFCCQALIYNLYVQVLYDHHPQHVCRYLYQVNHSGRSNITYKILNKKRLSAKLHHKFSFRNFFRGQVLIFSI